VVLCSKQYEYSVYATAIRESMTVYVAYYGYNYEGGSIVGVFESEIDAFDALEGEDTRADYSGVWEMEIGEKRVKGL